MSETVWRVNAFFSWASLGHKGESTFSHEQIQQTISRTGCVGFSPFFLTRAAAEKWTNGKIPVECIELGDLQPPVGDLQP